MFTVEVTSIHDTPPLPPSIGPFFGVMPRMFRNPSARAGEAGIGAACHVEVDLAGHKAWFIVAMSPTNLAPLNTVFAVFGEFLRLLLGVLAEGVEAGDAAEVEDVPIVGFQHAVLAGIGRVVPEVPALVLGRLAADLVGVDDEAVGAEALRHAEQLLAAVVHRPFVGRLELRHHLVEVGLEAWPGRAA